MKRGTRVRIGVAILFVALMGLVIDLGQRWQSPSLKMWGVAGFAVLQSVVSAWFLAHLDPPGRRFALPSIVLIAGVACAVGLAWMARVDDRLPLLPGLFLTVLFAWFYGAMPAFVLGCVFRRFRDVPGRGRVFLDSARTLFATSAFLSMLTLALPVSHWFHQWELDRAKAYVEAVAVEVNRASRSADRPVPDLEELLQRMGDPPPLLGPRSSELTCKERDGVLFLEFLEQVGFMSEIRWRYRVPSGPWESRRARFP